MKSNLKIIVLLVVGLLQYGCKTASVLPSNNTLSIPTQFLNEADTSMYGGSHALKEFFTDTHLLTLIEAALVNNPDQKIALQRVEAARASLRMGRGALLPALGATVAVGQQRFGQYTMDGVGNFDTNFSPNIEADQRMAEHLPDYYTALQSSWEIDLWGKLRNQKRAAAAKLLATNYGQQLVTTLLVAEIASAYYDLLALDNELEIIEKNIQLQERALEVVKAQKEAGRATELAVKQFTAQLFNTRNLLVRVKQRIFAAEAGINFLSGRFNQPIVRAQPILLQPLPSTLNAGVPAQMLKRRPDVLQAEALLQATHFNVAAARAAFLPSLNITATWGLQSFNPDKWLNPASLTYGIFGGLTAPVFYRNQLKADLQRANAEQQEAFFQYQKSILLGYQEVIVNLNQMHTLEEAAQFKQQEVVALNEGVAASYDLYIAGMASYLEVITAQKSVLEAELQLTETRKGQFVTAINLYRALGGGW
ncbi:MAG: TolC family protein [Cyclobacteriaceae bacterium]|nr:TolC family protein [Cyclobacteriaceae bacterium]